MESFYWYRKDDGVYVPTELTRGPWTAEAQHGGPPAALLGTRMQRLAPAGWQPSRITYELFKPVPLAPLSGTASVLRQGRNVAWLTGSLAVGGQEVLRAQGVWMRRSAPEPVEVHPVPLLPGPEQAKVQPFFDIPWTVGYHTGMEFRFLHGAFQQPGPAAAWARMRVPLLPEEPIEPLCRILIAVDSTNGISSALDFRQHWFTNADLTVHFHRLPRGEWVGLDARTTIEPDGVGLAESVVHDEEGALARGLQSLLVSPRT